MEVSKIRLVQTFIFHFLSNIFLVCHFRLDFSAQKAENKTKEKVEMVFIVHIASNKHLGLYNLILL